MLIDRQAPTSRPVTILSGFNFPLFTSVSSISTLSTRIAAEPSQTERVKNDSALDNAAHAFFRNNGAMAGVFTAAGLLFIAALALCAAYRRRARQKAQRSVEEHVVEGSFMEKREDILHLEKRPGTTYPLEQSIQSYSHHPFASPDISLTRPSSPNIMDRDQMERSSVKKAGRRRTSSALPDLANLEILAASNYHLSANLYLPSHPQPPPLVSEEARRRVRLGEKGKGRSIRRMISVESILSSKHRTSSKHTSSRSSQPRSLSSKHHSTATSTSGSGSKHYSTTSSMREEREWSWNRRRVRTTRVADDWAMFRPNTHDVSIHRREQERFEYELDGIARTEKDREMAYLVDEEVSKRDEIPILPPLPFQETTEPVKEAEDLGRPLGVSGASRIGTESRKTLARAESSRRKKSRMGSRKAAKNRDTRGPEAVFTLADALTHSRPRLELSELSDSGRVRSPFAPSSSFTARSERSHPGPSVDSHPYAR